MIEVKGKEIDIGSMKEIEKEIEIEGIEEIEKGTEKGKKKMKGIENMKEKELTEIIEKEKEIEIEKKDILIMTQINGNKMKRN